MTIMEQFQKERDVILQNGFEIIKEYSLVNNDGYIVKINGNKYDLRHWRNVYGASVNFWEISRIQEQDKEKITELVNQMNKECRGY